MKFSETQICKIAFEKNVCEMHRVKKFKRIGAERRIIRSGALW